MRLRVTIPSGQPFDWASASVPFRVGRADSCALRFQGESASRVSWEHAEIGLGSDGLYFVNDLGSANGTYVDGTQIAKPTLLRAGSTVQLGRTGPTLEVLELTATAQAMPVPAIPIALPIGQQPRAASQTTPATKAASRQSAVWSLVLDHWKSGAVVAGILIFGFVIIPRLMSPRKVDDAPREVAGKETDQPQGKSTTPAIPPKAPISSPPPRVETQPQPSMTLVTAVADSTPTSAAQTQADPWKEAREKCAAAFRLIVVEDPKTQAAWPFAGAVVVGEKSLLTTASVAIELAKFRERGWNISVMREGQQSRLAVRDMKVHAAYPKESEDQQLYFDMAVLFTAEPLTGAMSMASPAELTELETGRSLLCLAVDHAGDPLDRFQRLQPQPYTAKIFAVTSLPPQPSGPRLLHLRGSFSDKACGSPIVDNRGRLVALYCEPAPTVGPGTDDLRIHYAKVIEPQLVQLAANDPDEKVWAAVKTNAVSPSSQESPK